MKLIITELFCLIIYMSLWFALGYLRKRLDTVDTAWGGGFILVSIIALLNRHTLRTEIIAVLVLVWGLRLALHIFIRSGRSGPDPRYEELSSKWRRKNFWLRAYVSIFLTQGLIILLISLPISIAGIENRKISKELAIFGVILWVIGFIFESLADKQLSNFISQPDNKGRVMQAGLWRYSRHPNYFGELVQWWGIGILALGPLIGWIGLIGPAILTWLIVFISGVPSIEKRRSNDPNYQYYKKRTSVLIPLPIRNSK